MKEHAVTFKYLSSLLNCTLATLLIFFAHTTVLAQSSSNNNPFESQKNSHEYSQDDVDDISLESTKLLRDSLLIFFKEKLSLYDYADLTMSLDGLYAVKFKQRIGEIYQEYILEKNKEKFDEKVYKLQLIRRIGSSFGISLVEIKPIKSVELSMAIAPQKLESDYEPLFSALKLIRGLLGIPSFGSK